MPDFKALNSSSSCLVIFIVVYSNKRFSHTGNGYNSLQEQNVDAITFILKISHIHLKKI